MEGLGCASAGTARRRRATETFIGWGTQVSGWTPESPNNQPRRAASIFAMSIFCMVIIASNARLAAAGSGSVIAFVSAVGVICQDTPHLSLHQPQALSLPPLPTIAFQ